MFKGIQVFFSVVVLLLFSVPVAMAAPPQSQAPKPYQQHDLGIKASDFIVQINVTSPGAGAKWRVGTKKPILWTADPAKVGPLVKVLLIRKDQVQTADGYQAQLVIKDNCPSGSGGIQWDIPKTTPLGDYRILVLSKSNGKSGTSQPFKIIPQPVFKITQPAENSTWEIGKSYTVKWTYSGEALGPLALILFGSGGSRVDKIPLNGPNGDRSYLLKVPTTAYPGPFALMLIEVNEEAKLENDLIGYRGTSIGIKVVKEILK